MTSDHPDVTVTVASTVIECRGTKINLQLDDKRIPYIFLPERILAAAATDLIECLYTATNIFADRSRR